jgi:hypothetical protein
MLTEVYHRQHGDDCDRKNGKREDGAADGKAALIFGHRDVSYGWSKRRAERAESGFVMVDFRHLQTAPRGGRRWRLHDSRRRGLRASAVFSQVFGE